MLLYYINVIDMYYSELYKIKYKKDYILIRYKLNKDKHFKIILNKSTTNDIYFEFVNFINNLNEKIGIKKLTFNLFKANRKAIILKQSSLLKESITLNNLLNYYFESKKRILLNNK